MKLLILDNYDSFTYNLVHIVRALKIPFEVHRNDGLTLEDVSRFDKILLSPGPGIPDEAGIMKGVIREYSASKSILGICLGHQGIAEVFGARLFNIPNVLHGVTSETQVIDRTERMFSQVPDTFQATHYHSWAIRPDSIPDALVVTARNAEGLIMGIRHARFDVRGLQFHPESIMTPQGPRMIENWIAN